jgi:type I site-specific restriction-modification system R (restriction) subunit
MQPLNLPKYTFRFENRSNQEYIFDTVRKKFIICTPEEWVRQNIIQYLIHEKAVPTGFISIEKTIKINQMSRRYDILVANKSGEAIIIVECKSPSVKIQESAFQQIAQYNIHFQVPYLFVSNGLQHYFCRINHDKSMQFLQDIPIYSDL